MAIRGVLAPQPLIVVLFPERMATAAAGTESETLIVVRLPRGMVGYRGSAASQTLVVDGQLRGWRTLWEGAGRPWL